MSAENEKSVKNRLQRRAKRTRKKLKEAALDAFSEKSIDSVTIEEITSKADVGKGTLYQHFDDKGEIVVTLVGEAITHLIEYIRSYDSDKGTLEQKLEYLLNAHYDFFVNSKEEFLLLFQGKLLLKLQSDNVSDLEEPYLRYLGEIESHVSGFLAPKVAPQKVRRLAFAVAGFVFGFFSFAMIGMTEDEIKDSIKTLKEVFVKSLGEFLRS